MVYKEKEMKKNVNNKMLNTPEFNLGALFFSPPPIPCKSVKTMVFKRFERLSVEDDEPASPKVDKLSLNDISFCLNQEGT